MNSTEFSKKPDGISKTGCTKTQHHDNYHCGILYIDGEIQNADVRVLTYLHRLRVISEPSLAC